MCLVLLGCLYMVTLTKYISIDIEIVYTEVQVNNNTTKVVSSIRLLSDKSNATLDNYPLGPTILCDEGDTLTISVLNSLPNEQTVIHWHGIHMLGTPYMDGVPYVTQMPILPKEVMVYKFVANQAGTMWYHSHIEPQRNTLCFGALVASGKSDDIVLVISDLYSQAGNLQRLHLTQEDFQWVGDPQYILVNGKHNPTLSIQLNKTYTVRVISAATISYYNLSVANHNLTLIEAETTRLKPISLRSLWINAGERYSFTIQIDTGCYAIDISSLNSNVRTHIQLDTGNCTTYIHSNVTDTFSTSLLRNNDTKPIPNASREITITTTMLFNQYYLDNLTYDEATTAVLYDVYNGVIPKGVNLISIYPNEVVDIIFVNKHRGQHPIHIHGHSFWVMSNNSNPILRDTFTLSGYGWTRIRLLANNPGVWMIHCHVSWHVIMGMATLLSYPSNSIPPPPNTSYDMNVNYILLVLEAILLIILVVLIAKIGVIYHIKKRTVNEKTSLV